MIDDVVEETRERLDATIDGMDRRTRAYREAHQLRDLALEAVRGVVRDCDQRVRTADKLTRAAQQSAERATAQYEKAQEALKIRMSGVEQPGHDVEVKAPSGANGRDWTVDEIEETCFRLRVAGLGGEGRVKLHYNSISARIPLGSELIPTKAELAEREAEHAAAARIRRNQRIRRTVLAVPASMVAIPTSLAVFWLFKIAVTTLWSLLW